MMPVIVFFLLVAMASGPAEQTPACSDATIATVRDLYAAASYQEALDVLLRIDRSDAPPAVY
jgi:hypothetical protein